MPSVPRRQDKESKLEEKTKTRLKNKISYSRRKRALLRTVKDRVAKTANWIENETLRSLSVKRRINIINAMSGNTGTQCPTETQTKWNHSKA